MKPEDMQRMAEMAKGMGAGGGMGAGEISCLPWSVCVPSHSLIGLTGGGTMPPDMSKMLGDSKMMESALGMMKSMDDASLAKMLMSSGMVKNQEQAEQMAKQVCKCPRFRDSFPLFFIANSAMQMKGMSDSQMLMMAKAAGMVQGGAQMVGKAKDMLLSKGALLLAVAVVLLAVVLRVLGVL